MKEIDMGTDHLKALKGDGLGKIIITGLKLEMLCLMK